MSEPSSPPTYQLTMKDHELLIDEYPPEAPRDWKSEMQWLAQRRGIPLAQMPPPPRRK